MRFDILLNKLVSLMDSKGWNYVQTEDEKFGVFSNDFLFMEKVSVLFPVNDHLKDFPSQLLSSLRALVSIDTELKKHSVFLELRVLASNIKGKYSKDKNKWILREPNSKYKNSEIPDIYIPLN